MILNVFPTFLIKEIVNIVKISKDIPWIVDSRKMCQIAPIYKSYVNYNHEELEYTCNQQWL